jgi:DNA-binding response OmpR family regulator
MDEGKIPKKVLIIEDYPPIVEMMENFLSLSGFKVITAPSGAVGLERAARERPDIILLDIMMPAMDGLEVCKKLKEDPKTAGIPVMIVSIKAAEEYKINGAKAGAVDYITKPFDPEELVARVKKILG